MAIALKKFEINDPSHFYSLISVTKDKLGNTFEFFIHIHTEGFETLAYIFMHVSPSTFSYLLICVHMFTCVTKPDSSNSLK